MEEILIGSVDRTIPIWIADPASTTGAGKTGLAAAAITVTYTRYETDNDVVHSDVTSSLSDLSALTDAHADWGWKEVSSTLSKGLYRLDIADAVFASGAWYAVVQVTITSGTAAATPKVFKLVTYDPSVGVNVTHLLGTGWLTPGTAGTPDVNAKLLGATPQTGRDIGTSVLLSSGTGTGQLDFTSGVVKANFVQILASAITGTAAQLAAAITKFFNVATPTGTVNSLPDAVAGAAGGVFIAGSNAATTANITGNITGNLSGSVGSVTGAVGSVTGAVGSVTGAVGSVTGAVGSVTGNVGGNVVGSVASVTAGVTVTTNNDKTGYALSAAGVDAIWDEAQSGHTTAGTFGKYLDDEISQVSGGGGGGGVAGEGSTAVTLVIKDGSNNPLDGVAVWVTTDSAGSNVVAGTIHTDAFGEVDFLLDPGDYYRWASRSGLNFTNPASFTVS